MRQTKSLPAPRWSLVRRVLAGCRQSLLGDGPSRHYLCNPCVGAWTHTPPALECTCFRFLESTGLTPRKMRSAREIVPAMNVNREPYFGAAVIRDLQAHASPRLHPQHLRAGRPGRLHHASPGWLPIPGCGIATPTGQLTRLDLHQLDCALSCSIRVPNGFGPSPPAVQPGFG